MAELMRKTGNFELLIHAKWLYKEDCGITECSNCGWTIEECIGDKYCRECGAKMDLEG